MTCDYPHLLPRQVADLGRPFLAALNEAAQAEAERRRSRHRSQAILAAAFALMLALIVLNATLALTGVY